MWPFGTKPKPVGIVYNEINQKGNDQYWIISLMCATEGDRIYLGIAHMEQN